MSTFAFEVTIQGRGGHGSRPDRSINPIDCFVSIHTALNRLCPIGTQLVIDRIDGGTSSNIIPDKLTFSAVFHCTDTQQLDCFRADLERVCNTFCDCYNCKIV